MIEFGKKVDSVFTRKGVIECFQTVKCFKTLFFAKPQKVMPLVL